MRTSDLSYILVLKFHDAQMDKKTNEFRVLKNQPVIVLTKEFIFIETTLS